MVRVEGAGAMSLVLSDLSKTFSTGKGEEISALEGINLTVESSEFVCILGPSGCGKTTLLRIVGGLEQATSGSVILDGIAINQPNPRMAMIFQEYSLFPWRTVIENISFGLELRGHPREGRDKEAARYLDLVGLAGFERRFPYELSGGMRQRAAVARALAVDPAILLMDEPFGALDAQTRNRMQQEILSIWEKTRKTILFVTHSVDEAVFLADRIVVMTRRPGRIREIIGVPHSHPRERTSGQFVEIRKKLLDLIRVESESPGKV
jgi:NitT/TauT family transport system ATP-binding protein